MTIRIKYCRATALLLAMATAVAQPALAESPPPGEAWKGNPHHGTINGATGRPIPCVCRFQGRDYRLTDVKGKVIKDVLT